MLQSSIPLVDISQDEAAAARQVYAACSGPGFFYAANHGIPQDLVNEVFRQMRAAFAMPEEAKVAMLADENNRGCEQLPSPLACWQVANELCWLVDAQLFAQAIHCSVDT
jgi:isopenicillin N synthase-like dioxygenase